MDYSKFDFLITGYPRSGTAWFASLFSIGEYMCIHEPETLGSEYLSSVISEFRIVGASTSSPVSDRFNGKLPGKIIVIERQREECIESFMRKFSTEVDLSSSESKKSTENALLATGTIEEFVKKNSLALRYKFYDVFFSDFRRRKSIIFGMWEYIFDRSPSAKCAAKIVQCLKFNVQLSKLKG